MLRCPTRAGSAALPCCAGRIAAKLPVCLLACLPRWVRPPKVSRCLKTDFCSNSSTGAKKKSQSQGIPVLSLGGTTTTTTTRSRHMLSLLPRGIIWDCPDSPRGNCVSASPDHHVRLTDPAPVRNEQPLDLAVGPLGPLIHVLGLLPSSSFSALAFSIPGK